MDGEVNPLICSANVHLSNTCYFNPLLPIIYLPKIHAPIC